MFEVYVNEDYIGSLTEGGLFIFLDTITTDHWNSLTGPEKAAWERSGLTERERTVDTIRVRGESLCY